MNEVKKMNVKFIYVYPPILNYSYSYSSNFYLFEL